MFSLKMNFSLTRFQTDLEFNFKLIKLLFSDVFSLYLKKEKEQIVSPQLQIVTVSSTKKKKKKKQVNRQVKLKRRSGSTREEYRRRREEYWGDWKVHSLESAGEGGFMVSGEQHSLGEGDLSRLVTGSKWRPAGPWCPGVSVLLILCSCPLCIVPWPPPATPSTGMPFSERNSSRSTYWNTRATASSFSFSFQLRKRWLWSVTRFERFEAYLTKFGEYTRRWSRVEIFFFERERERIGDWNEVPLTPLALERRSTQFENLLLPKL